MYENSTLIEVLNFTVPIICSELINDRESMKRQMKQIYGEKDNKRKQIVTLSVPSHEIETYIQTLK